MTNAIETVVVFGAGVSKRIVNFPTFDNLIHELKSERVATENKTLRDCILSYETEKHKNFDLYLVNSINHLNDSTIISEYMELISDKFFTNLEDSTTSAILSKSKWLSETLRRPKRVLVTTNYDPLLNILVYCEMYQELKHRVQTDGSHHFESLIEDFEVGNNAKPHEFVDWFFSLLLQEAYKQVCSFQDLKQHNSMSERIFYLHGHCYKRESTYKLIGEFETVQNETRNRSATLTGETTRHKVYENLQKLLATSEIFRVIVVGMSKETCKYVIQHANLSAEKLIYGYHEDSLIEADDRVELNSYLQSEFQERFLKIETDGNQTIMEMLRDEE